MVERVVRSYAARNTLAQGRRWRSGWKRDRGSERTSEAKSNRVVHFFAGPAGGPNREVQI
jgi:hypothetical protein